MTRDPDLPRLRRHLKAIVVCPGIFAVLLPVVFLVAAQLVAAAWSPAGAVAVHPLPAWWPAGVVLVVLGGALFVWTNRLFHRANGTLHPTDGPTTLVTAGPYSWTRNPMIIGVFLILGGVAVLLGSWTLLGYLVLFSIAKTIYIAKHEEPVLRAQHGRAYEEYLARVPRRWLPWPPAREATREVSA
jgi:protein-S-isoprenylcysteine O-methyltransferase Ste14